MQKSHYSLTITIKLNLVLLFNYYLIVDELMDMIDDLEEKINKLETEVMDLNVGLKENEQNFNSLNVNVSKISENVDMNKVTQPPTSHPPVYRAF